MHANEPRKMTVVYTAGYAPPEQMVGRPEPRSDLFALGATLYHLATGKEPDGIHTAAAIDELLSDPRCSIAPEQRWFFDLLRINLAENPDDRYFSAAEFKADLEKRCVTREVSCPKCQTINEVRRPFCTRCATALTAPGMPCRQCGKPSRMGCRWCIYCGNRLG
jgi:serine/threonine-protein kinase